MSDPFPEAAINEVAAMVERIDTIDHVHLRPLVPTDSHRSFGVGGAEWRPTAQLEIGKNAPPVNLYDIEFQILMKHSNRAEGRKQLNLAANTFRQMVFTDADFHLALGSYEYESYGLKERFSRLMVDRIRYLTDDATGGMSGTFLQLALLDVTVRTETC